ncbi:MAG: hypothetical protein FWB97_01315 [Oscillospiraceae bacterium]|nr:hypothetical protein [Oscillospiraceae bacterium]
MENTVNGDYVSHSITLAMNLLILGITKLSDENHHEQVIMRSTLTLLETLNRNINRQMERKAVSE